MGHPHCVCLGGTEKRPPDGEGPPRSGRVQRNTVRGRKMKSDRVFKMTFASVYPHYITKAERKGRTKAEVDQVICWLTGYSAKGLGAQNAKKKDLPSFF